MKIVEDVQCCCFFFSDGVEGTCTGSSTLLEYSSMRDDRSPCTRALSTESTRDKEAPKAESFRFRSHKFL